MSALIEVVPLERTSGVGEAVTRFADRADGLFDPFATAVIDFCAALSLAISRDAEARSYPELQALAFHMRRATLAQLRAEYEALLTPHTVLVPRGTVFHMPPSNVDTIFLYSWLTSVLMGNRNIVRLSQRESSQFAALCRLYRTTAGAHPLLSANTAMFRYGHDDLVTQAFSDICDVRVIWGGDATVNAIRKVALPPHAREITFPDRYSMAVFRADVIAGLPEADLTNLAERLFNDIYWFDQMACSSPQLVVWVGAESCVRHASGRLFDALADDLQRRRFRLPTGVGIEKLTFLARAAIDRDIPSARRYGSLLMVAYLDTLEGFDRTHCGAGFLFESRFDKLLDLVPYVRRRDQTLTYFGFEQPELRTFAAAARGQGIDRIVPVGQALNFHRYWDGLDLLAEFSRRIHVV